MAQSVVGEIEMHSVANLATVQTPLATFFPSKKQALLNFWDSPALPREREVLPRGRAHLPLSLFSERRRETALSIKHRYYVAFKTLNASIAEITAQLLSLSCVYLIFIRRRLDYQDFFLQINILQELVM